MARGPDNFKRGTTELLVLMLLDKHNDLHAYRMINIFKERSNGLYTVLESSLYLVLINMESKGYITSYEKTVKKKLKHRCYNITEEGRARLRYLISEYDSVTEGINLIRNWEDDQDE